MAGVEQLVATLGANATQFTVNGLSKGTPYRFRMMAFNTAGESTASFVNVTTLTERPARTANFAGTAVSANEIQLTWSDATGVTTYRLYQIDPAGRMTQVATLAGNATSYRVTELAATSSYRFTILASNSGGYVQSNWITVNTES